VRHQLHSETRETPAEYSPSDLSKPCLYANKCGHRHIDLDEDTFATVDTPLGELIVCEEHIIGGAPLITCGCGEDELDLEHTGVWEWRTKDSVVVIDGELWNTQCDAEKLA